MCTFYKRYPIRGSRQTRDCAFYRSQVEKGQKLPLKARPHKAKRLRPISIKETVGDQRKGTHTRRLIQQKEEPPPMQ